MTFREALTAKPTYKKEYFWLRLIGMPITAMFMLSYLHWAEIVSMFNWAHIVSTWIITAIVWELSCRTYYFFDAYYPWESGAARRIILQLPVSLAFAVLTILGATMVKGYLLTGEILICSGSDLLVSALLALFVNSIYAAVYFYKEWKNSLVESERLQRERILSQYEALKCQVNPHFLFNSLNTLVTLINEDQAIATRFVEQLSKVYRYVLQHKEHEMVTLGSELRFMESFLFLMKMRFGDNLKIEIDIDRARYDDLIAPLTLQMLIENAIKHNVVSQQKPLHIRLSVNGANTLVVSNNVQRKSAPSDSTGVGLQNIKDRYDILSHRPVQVLSTALDFSVSLPLLRMEPQQ